MSQYTIRKFYDDSLMKLQDQLTDGITNNLQLDDICYKIFPNYLGTRSSDQFPKYIKEDQCFILNTDDKKGIHWVAFYKRNKKLYAYDSFSRPVSGLSKFWKNKKIVSANIDRDQSFLSNECGSRAISWLVTFKRYGDKIINII